MLQINEGAAHELLGGRLRVELPVLQKQGVGRKQARGSSGTMRRPDSASASPIEDSNASVSPNGSILPV